MSSSDQYGIIAQFHFLWISFSFTCWCMCESFVAVAAITWPIKVCFLCFGGFSIYSLVYFLLCLLQSAAASFLFDKTRVTPRTKLTESFVWQKSFRMSICFWHFRCCSLQATIRFDSWVWDWRERELDQQVYGFCCCFCYYSLHSAPLCCLRVLDWTHYSVLLMPTRYGVQ